MPLNEVDRTVYTEYYPRATTMQLEANPRVRCRGRVTGLSQRLVVRLLGEAFAVNALVATNGQLGTTMQTRPPLPPFTYESATQKVRLAEDAWNTRDPDRVSLVYTEDTIWRNRAEFPRGRENVRQFLQRKWSVELDYRLIKELWSFTDNRIAVRFAYEWHDDSRQWYRSYGNENWEFNAQGLMERRFASINDLPIKDSDRLFHWPLGRRPDAHAGLSELGL